MKSRPLTSDPRLGGRQPTRKRFDRPSTVKYTAKKFKKTTRKRGLKSSHSKKRSHSYRLPNLEKGKKKAKLKFYNDVAMFKGEINRFQQHNKILKTKIKSLQDEQKKFRNCIDLLRSNLKDELISVPLNKLEIPLTIALKRRIKNIKMKMDIVDTEIISCNKNLDKKWLSGQDEIDKYQRKLRNLILNIEFRKSIKNEKNQKTEEELNTITSDQEAVSENLYSEFEISCNKLKRAEAFSIDTSSRLQYAPLLLKEKKKIIEQLKTRSQQQDEEIEAFMKELGIKTQEEIDEIVGDQNGIEANKRRQKNLKNNIDNIRRDNQQLHGKVMMIENKAEGLKQQEDDLKVEITNERIGEEKKREELLRKIEASKKRLKNLRMQRRLQKEQEERSIQRTTSAVSRDMGSNSSMLEMEKEDEIVQLPKKPRILLEEIQDIGLRLSMDLRYREITMNEVLHTLQRHTYGDLQISILNAKEFFKEHPMSMKNQEEIEKLSRYLIEDNDEPMVEFNEELSLSIYVVKSILKKLLCSYRIRSIEETEKIRDEIRKYFSDKMYALQDSVERLGNELERKYCTVEELDAQFKLYDIKLIHDHWDQILLDLYMRSRNLDELPFEAILEIYYMSDSDEEN